MWRQPGRRLRGVGPAACLATLLGACAPPDGPAAGDTDAPPPLPVVACAAASWTRLPGPLGALVGNAPRPDLSFQATSLDLLLGAGGLSGLSPTPQDVEVHEFRYTTQDRGQEVEATGLVALPAGAGDGTPWPVVLLIHSFAGLQGPCAPSAGRLEEAIEPVLVASRGFVVIAPDLIGLDGSALPPARHAPLVAEQAAIGAWNALRAGRTLLARDDIAPPAGVRGDVVLWGYSQGGHGALVTERLGAYLAPEEHVAAVIAGVPPLDARAAVRQAVGGWSDATGLSALILAGMYGWYRPSAPLGTVLANTPPVFLADAITAALDAPAESCGDGVDVEADSVDDLFSPGFVAAATAGDWETVEPFGCFLTEASLPWMSVPSIRATPSLLVFGTEDHVVDVAAQAPGVAALCEAGAPLRTITCEGGDHAFAGLWSIPEQVAFVKARLTGAPLEGTCAAPSTPVVCSATTP